MKDFNTLTISGISYSQNELQSKAEESLTSPLWQQEFWAFITAWLNEEEFINVYTSGSTGPAKKIQLKKTQMLASAKMTSDFLKLKQGEKALLGMSAKHIGGMMMIVRAFYAKLDLHFVEPQANPLLNTHETIDFIAIVPYQAKRILTESPQALKAIKHVLIGGGLVDSQLEESLIQEGVSAYSSFGMTETISHFALRKIGQEQAYHCLPGITIQSAKEGKLIIHAPMLQETEIQTNDLIKPLSPSSFIWLGRADFAIETGGLKLIPSQLEELLSTKISRRFFISSLPHDELTNQIILIIEGEPFELSKDLFASLGKYQRPKQVFFLKTFMETGSGKIDRMATKELAIN